ncbi:MAG TPA: cation:proton antiporter subunit C [Bacteroidales bacterium]|nr:cation:proton antiporter subunit C [Bacteroidales bacterium]HPE55564.1 cation:proton antiporter subunit C [Bacteroidales bacterium]HRX95590.1 cation:proton antiporter subunit C [Bacteroidales bacterium]
MEYLTLQNIGLVTGFMLMLIGLYGALTQKNILRIIVAFTIFDAGLNLVIVALSYIKGRVAPIIDQTTGVTNLSEKFVDPIPQALVLTSIVIGVGVTGVMLTFALRMFKTRHSLDINDFKQTKW